MTGGNITLYAIFSKSNTITLSYNANGGSGSTAPQSKQVTQYYNNGNYTTPTATFTLQSSSFTKSGYLFNKWAIGSTSGTQYAAGTSVTLSSNTTFYAIWRAAELVVYQMTVNDDWSTTININNTKYVNITTDQNPVQTYIYGPAYFDPDATGEFDEEEENTGNISISYGEFNTAIVEYKINTSNHLNTDRYGTVHVNNALIFDTEGWGNSRIRERGYYTYVTNSSSIATKVYVHLIDDDGNSWVDTQASITKITLVHKSQETHTINLNWSIDDLDGSESKEWTHTISGYITDITITGTINGYDSSDDPDAEGYSELALNNVLVANNSYHSLDFYNLGAYPSGATLRFYVSPDEYGGGSLNATVTYKVFV